MAKYMPETFLVMWGVEQMQVRTGFRKESRIGVREDSGDRYNYVEDVPEYENVQGFDFSVPALISGEQRLIASAKTCLTHAAAEADVSGDYDDSLDQVGGSDD
jgi:choline dehydrogenase-like flavoprotein